jgi:hypothetical protein
VGDAPGSDFGSLLRTVVVHDQEGYSKPLTII